MTPSDELYLFCYWQQLGNKWVEIAKLMGRSENWVKNNWKKILRREGLAPNDDLTKHVPALIERLKTKVANYTRSDIPEFVDAEVNPPTEQQPYEMHEEEMKEVTYNEWEELPRFAIEEEKMSDDIDLSNCNEAIDEVSEDYDFSQDTYEENTLNELIRGDPLQYSVFSLAKNPFCFNKFNDIN